MDYTYFKKQVEEILNHSTDDCSFIEHYIIDNCYANGITPEDTVNELIYDDFDFSCLI